MDYIISESRLKGSVPCYGAKNCLLALLGASILTDDTVVLNNCPDIVDVKNMISLLAGVGKKVVVSGDTIQISGKLATTSYPSCYATLLRGSILALGSTLAKYGCVNMPLPGGCAIGSRPIDIHLGALKSMGADVTLENNGVTCAGNLHGCSIKLAFASVGATENILCASVLADGITTIANCALEPEIVALANMLKQMGAQIEGIGTSVMQIKGVQKLHGTTYTVIPDRIVTATYLAGAMATLGDVTVTGCNPRHLQSFVNLCKKNAQVRIWNDAIRVNCTKTPNGYGKVETLPYPAFATDMQSLLLTMAACSSGHTQIVENLFENRLQHNANQLNKMGANVTVSGNVAYVQGARLHGSSVVANDLRGGAGLVIAGLCAKGTTVLHDVEHVNRGYVNLAQNLNKLGANITVN